MSKIDDETRLRHIIAATEEIKGFIQGKTRVSLDQERMLVLSLVKLLEIIGEAASKISREKQMEISQIPWAGIVGMRNRLVHAYFDIDLDIVWQTVTEDITPLLEELKKLNLNNP
jgi:hypothetical protein